MSSQQRTRPMRKVALWALALCTLAGAVVYTIRSQRPLGQRTDESRPPPSLSTRTVEQALTLEERWEKEASLTVLDTMSERDISNAFAVSIHDPDRLATDTEHEQLVLAITERIGYLIDPSPEHYLDNLRTNPLYKPLAPDDPDYSRLRSVYNYELGKNIDPGANHETIARELWTAIMGEKGYTLAEIGQGGRGIATHLYKARTPDQISAATLMARGMDGGYWFAQPININSLPLYPAAVAPEDYAREHHSVLIGASHFIARFTNGNLCGIGMLWYYDEEAREWVCFTIVCMGTRGMRLFL